MERAADILIMTYDLAASIDVKGVGERGTGWIDRGENARVEQKTMLGSGIYVNTHDLAGSVNPGSPGARGAGNIDRDERAVVQQKTVARASGVGVATTIWPTALILLAEVAVAPGTSIVVKVNAKVFDGVSMRARTTASIVQRR